MTAIERASGNVIAGQAQQAAEPDDGDIDAGLIPGMTIADGRIRLLISYGGPRHLQFWQAADTATGQQLAVTVIDPEGAMPTTTVGGILSHTARLRGLTCRGLPG